jgi:hypothetical protein
VLRQIIIAVLSLTIALLQSGPAFAYAHANAYGGSTEHSYGSTSHQNAYGGSSSHTYGEGTTHTNVYGGTTSGRYGSGATHTNTYGATSYHPAGYYGYPPPPPHYDTGCYNCYHSCVGCIAGAAVVGAAAAYSIGEMTTSVPTSGCANQIVSGVTYYVCGSTWFKPAYGANGLYYTVVPAP